MPSRDSSTIYTMNGVEGHVRSMEYPYGYIGSYTPRYDINSILSKILVEEGQAEAGNFPHNIAKHFWIREGQNDGDSWMACGQLTNGNYFFYTGGCDYTGFDCQGGMDLWVSASWKNIIEHAMTEEQYRLYIIQSTIGEVKEDEDTVCGVCMIRLAKMPNTFTKDGRLCEDCYWKLHAKK